MRVLVACEFSGVVRDAFIKRGHDAYSCDILEGEGDGPHIQDDVLKHLDDGWDLMIAHPPCTYLTVTGNKWMNHPRFPNRQQDRKEAVEFFMSLAECNIPKKCLENPVGVVSTLWRKPDQIIQPYQFGDPHSKKTCLWLEGLPKLVPTRIVEPQFYIYKDGRRDPLWHMETMKLPPLERMKARSRTFRGIADAMAQQWG